MNKLIVAGIGPGAYKMLTIQVERALRECDVIAGYVKYVDLLKPYFPEKENRQHCRLTIVRFCGMYAALRLNRMKHARPKPWKKTGSSAGTRKRYPTRTPTGRSSRKCWTMSGMGTRSISMIYPAWLAPPRICW